MSAKYSSCVSLSAGHVHIDPIDLNACRIRDYAIIHFDKETRTIRITPGDAEEAGARLVEKGRINIEPEISAIGSSTEYQIGARLSTVYRGITFSLYRD